MKRLFLATSALSLALAACGYNNEGYNNEAANYSEGNYSESQGNYTAPGNAAEGSNYGETTTAAATWPPGARIVVENGVTYRVEPGGVRVALGPSDSRIVVENGVRYRVDPSGTRVRIDESGAEVVIPG